MDMPRTTLEVRPRPNHSTKIGPKTMRGMALATPKKGMKTRSASRLE
jgi:hypothetical protein